MTIPGRGDLSPRRRRRNWRRRLLVFVAVLVVLGGGYAGYQLIRGGSSGPEAVLPPCPATTPTPSAVETDRVVVRNATLTTGLATDVSRALRQRGFQVAKVGNTLFRGKGVATIRYSADRARSAQLLATQFAGATLFELGGSRLLEVDIGPKYRTLVPLAQAKAAEHAVATPTPTPSVTASPTCTP